MKNTINMIGFTALSMGLLVLIACSPRAELISQKEFRGVQLLTISSPAIADNTLGEKPEQIVSVYLPPDYETSNREYPVVYYLHVFTLSALSTISYAPPVFDRYFTANPEEGFIFVGINGRSTYGGSYWMDSPITGGWETFAVKEVPEIMSEQFRIKTGPENTAIAGWAMGGYAAVHKWLTYPETYGHLYALAPDIPTPGSFETVLFEHYSGSRIDYPMAVICAFVPDYLDNALSQAADEEELIKEFGYPDLDPDLAAQLEKNFGLRALEELADEYLPQRSGSSSVLFEYGDSDRFVYVQEASRELARLFEERGIASELEVFAGGHISPRSRLEESMLPFFVQAFAP
jgi:S-formylglutathione hydrolase FrmB